MPDNSTILIVDDHLSGRKVLSGLLSGQQYQLAFASSGEEALVKAVELNPDLILLDVMMPGLDGFEVCQQLRADAQLAEIPIIFVTALDDEDSRVQGLEAGGDDFISKPFNPVELQARVRSLTRLNRYRRLLTERTYRQEAEAEVHQRNQELILLNQVILTAASTLNIQEILYVACQTLAQAFDLPQATAVLLDEAQTQFANVVEYQAAVFHPSPRNPEESLQSNQTEILEAEIPIVGLLSEYLSTRRSPLAVVSEPSDPRLNPVYDLMCERGIGSLLIIPILIGDQIVSLIELGADAPFYFDDQASTFAQTIATAVGQCMETTQLYQLLEQHAENLEETVVQRTYQLKNERDRTQAILEALGDAVIVTDSHYVVQYLNPAAVALTGFSEAEAKGRNWLRWQSQPSRDLDLNGDGEQLYDEIAAMVNRGQTWHGEINTIRKDGTLYDAMLTIAPLLDLADPKQPIGFVSVQSDITVLKEAERLRTLHQEQEKQAALDRLRHTFLGTINHELRTPLTLIFQSIEMLEDAGGAELAKTQLDVVMALRRHVSTLGQMVEGLTQVAAFLSKQETVRPVLAPLKPVFNNVIPLAQFKARSKEITVETDIVPNLPLLPLDVKQMEEALTQLVDNAIKFNQEGGTVKISAQADEAWVMIRVSDTGLGIEEAQMNRIWEVFEQGADPLRRAQEGLGLGLVLARYIVEAHQGTIKIETTPGQGSAFTMKLPRSTRHE